MALRGEAKRLRQQQGLVSAPVTERATRQSYVKRSCLSYISALVQPQQIQETVSNLSLT